MAKAKKLPSGAWRTQTCKTVHGKVIRKSFTVHPDQTGGDSRRAKDQSELLARNWRLSKESTSAHGLVVKDAIEQYIEDRSKVLSPSTVRGYKLILESFEPIWDIYISDIETAQIQRIINDWSMDLKTKTIRNRVALLLSVLDYNGIEKRFKVRYPTNNSKKVVSPDIEDVQMFLRNAKGIMIPIIHLTALGSLRRGEVAGLREMDISRDMCTVTINGDMVQDSSGAWIYKPFPKTQGSIRTVQLPKFVIDGIPVKDNPKDLIFDITPAAMSDRFKRLADKLSLPFTLHSLRHFAASFRTDLGIPRKYVEEVGGWDKDSVILQRTYDNTMDSSRRKYTQIANKFMEENFEGIGGKHAKTI